MTNMNTHDQLIDEAGSILETVRRNIRAARELALHMDMEVTRHDQILRNIHSAELEAKSIATRRDDCPYCGGSGHIDDHPCICETRV